VLACCSNAAISIYGAGRVAVHLSPRGSSNGVADSDPEATFGYVARELGRRNIAFLAAREKAAADEEGFSLKREFGGVYVANEANDQRGAQELLANGKADAVAFATLFIANPDLPQRFAENASLNEPDAASFYTPGPIGYTGYPTLSRESSICVGCGSLLAAHGVFRDNGCFDQEESRSTCNVRRSFGPPHLPEFERTGRSASVSRNRSTVLFPARFFCLRRVRIAIPHFGNGGL